MKKIGLIILLVAIISASIILIAFNIDTNKDDENKIKVVVSNFASYDFVKAIIKDTDSINLKFLLSPGEDSHSYDPTPQDMILMQNSDMFVYIGGELETWADKIVETFEDENQKVINISKSVNLKEELTIEGAEHGHHHHDDDCDDDDCDEDEHEHDHDEDEHEHDHDEDEHEHDHDEHEYDMHIWSSPKNAVLMVEELTKQIVELDPANKNKYTKNSNDYINEIKAVDNEIREIVNNGKRKRLVFGDKMPMQYFIEYYGLDVNAAFAGCSSETEPSTKTIIFLTDLVKNENIPVVLYTELNDGKVANVIVNEANNGSKAMQIQTLHNLKKDDFQNGATYVTLMKKNVEVLKEALK